MQKAYGTSDLSHFVLISSGNKISFFGMTNSCVSISNGFELPSPKKVKTNSFHEDKKTSGLVKLSNSVRSARYYYHVANNI